MKYLFAPDYKSPWFAVQNVITDDRSDFHEKGQGQRSKVKVTEVIT